MAGMAEEYWLDKLSGIDHCQLYSFKGEKPYKKGSVSLVIPGGMMGRLDDISKGDAKSMFILMAAAIVVNHACYTGSEDVILNSPGFTFHERGQCKGERVYYRVRVSPQAALSDVVSCVKDGFTAAFRHRDYDHRLFYDKFTRNKTGNEKALTQLGLVFRGVCDADHDDPLARLCFLYEGGDSLSITFDQAGFDVRLIEQYGLHALDVLDVLLRRSKTRIGDLSLPDQDQKNRLLSFNKPAVPLPAARTVVQWVKQACLWYPEHIALQTLSKKVTYSELDEYSDRLAHFLVIEQQLKPETIVVILLDRNEWLIIAMLGILKAGCAYLPIDPNYPRDRVEYLINDCASPMVITEERYLHLAGGFDCFAIDKVWEQGREEAIDRSVSEGLAYIIYTSGSTGNPKGVMVEHAGLMNHIVWFTGCFGVTAADRTILVASPCFDGTVTCIWSILVSGAALHILPNECVVDPAYLLNYIQEHRISFLKMVPSFFGALVSAPAFEKEYKDWPIRSIKLGGEPANIGHMRRYLDRYPATIFGNHYGTTETTIGSTIHLVTAANFEEFASLTVIGSPFDNCEVYILDQKHRLLPVGVTGEIYLGGVGVSRGYYNREELTAQKFIDNPFKPGQRIYKTGDYGCWTCDGTIISRGREDLQIKIRGYRVELGEIESTIRQFEGIGEVVVLAVGDQHGPKELLAFIKSFIEPDILLLRTHIRQKLPDFMMPAKFRRVEHIPLTLNGKVDRQRLISLPYTALDANTEWIGPRGEKERLLVKVLKDVLQKDRISVKDDFFVLGGDSIKAILVTSRLRQKNYLLNIRDILLYPVIEVLATRLTVNRSEDGDATVIKGPTGLSPAQWSFFSGDDTDRHHFNQAALLFSRDRVSAEGIDMILQKLVGHHDVLRMVYYEVDGRWIQEDAGQDRQFYLEEIDLTAEECLDGPGQYADALQSGIRLDTGPLLRVGLYHAKDGDLLLVVVHHLVVDGVSWRILLEDLATLYDQHCKGVALSLPVKTRSFGYWQSRQETYSTSPRLKKEISFWNKVMEAGGNCCLVSDKKEGSNLYRDEAELSFILDKESSRRIAEIHRIYGTEINDVLLTALCMSLRDIFGMQAMLVWMEGHGREYIGEAIDVSRTVGWFTTKYPVFIDLKTAATAGDCLIMVKETLHRVPNKGIGYGILRYLSDAVMPDSAVSETDADLTFNYLGDFGQALSTTAHKEHFQFSRGYRGQAISPARSRGTKLRVTGIVLKGELEITLSYSSQQYERSTIEKLNTAIKGWLLEFTGWVQDSRERVLTPCDMTYSDLTMEELVALNASRDIEDIYELSPLQKGLYFHWNMDKASYLRQFSYLIEGEVEVEKLEMAVQRLIQRHPVLRTFFVVSAEGRELQVVKTSARATVSYRDVSHKKLSSGEMAAFLEEYMQHAQQSGIELGSAPLFQVSLFRSGSSSYGLVLRWHHIILDGWSVAILLSELLAFYSDLAEGRRYDPGAAPYYSTYIRWLRNLDRNTALSFWKQYLQGFDGVKSLPLASRKAAGGAQRFREKYLLVGGQEAESLKGLCRRLAVPENTFFMALWATLLAQYNHSTDVVMGIVVSGRPWELEGVESMVGMLVNTIPIRMTFDESMTFEKLLLRVKEDMLAIEPHQYTPLSDIRTAIGAPGMIDHVFIYENYPADPLGKINGYTRKAGRCFDISMANETRQTQTNYDFNIVIRPAESEFEIAFTCDQEVYSEEVIQWFIGHYAELIRSVTAQPAERVLDKRFHFQYRKRDSGMSVSIEDRQEAF